MAASCAPKVLDPSIHTGTSRPAPGTACTAWPARRAGSSQQLHHVAREVVRVRHQVPPHGARGDHVGARRAAEAEVDAARVQGGEGAELLRDHQRRVVRQHDAAGADADGARARRDVGQRDGRWRRWRCRHVVVLGHPVALVAQRLGVPREVERVAQRLPGVAAFGDGGEV
jgi:hypothetical protein